MPIKWILDQPVYQIKKWLNDEHVDFIQASNGRKPVLSIEDRIMRALMFNGNKHTKILELMFGQKKTTIYEDAWLIMKVILKVFGDKLKKFCIKLLDGKIW